MRVTRATVPYYFWAATVAAVAIIAFAWTRLHPHGETLAERAWGLPFLIPILVALFVIPQASFRLQREVPDARMATAKRVATALWIAGFGSSAVVLAVGFFLRQPAYGALMQLVPICYYIALLGQFAIIKEFG